MLYSREATIEAERRPIPSLDITPTPKPLPTADLKVKLTWEKILLQGCGI